jgi:hypothetical protein
MKKPEALQHMQAVRAAWQAAVDRIPVERMTEAAETEPWSIKDEIAHVAFYYRRAAGLLGALARGVQPTHAELHDHAETMPEFTDLDSFNATIQARYASMSATEVINAAQRAFADLVAAVEALPDDLWHSPTPFTGERSIAAALPFQTWVHYAKHLPPLEMFIYRMAVERP